MKKAVIIGLALAVVIVAALLLLVSNLDSLVARIIQSEGSRTTGTEVKVASVDISLKDSRGSLQGLTIASPEGFDPDHAFTLSNITVDLDLSTIRENPIVVTEIRVDDPRVAVQVLADGSSNLTTLKKHLDSYMVAKGGGGDEPATDKRLRIEKVTFTGGRISLDATALGDKDVRELDLPGFTLTDIGGRQGAAPDEIAKSVLGALTRKAVEAVAKAGVEQKAKETGKSLLKKIGG